MQLVASQMDQDLRAQCITDVSLYGVDTLILMRLDAIVETLRYGYGVRGKPIRCHKLVVRERISDCSYDGEWDFRSSDC